MEIKGKKGEKSDNKKRGDKNLTGVIELVILRETRVVEHLEKPVISVVMRVILLFVVSPRRPRIVQVKSTVVMGLITLPRNQKKSQLRFCC